MGVTEVAPNTNAAEMIGRARALRRDLTLGEQKLWSELCEFRKLYGLHVRKQAPIGPFIVDFAIHAAKLVIEVDGEHHFEPEQQAYDARRDAWLKKEGYRVLRFTTGDLDEAFEGCVEEIMREAGLI